MPRSGTQNISIPTTERAHRIPRITRSRSGLILQKITNKVTASKVVKGDTKPQAAIQPSRYPQMPPTKIPVRASARRNKLISDGRQEAVTAIRLPRTCGCMNSFVVIHFPVHIVLYPRSALKSFTRPLIGCKCLPNWTGGRISVRFAAGGWNETCNGDVPALPGRKRCQRSRSRRS